MNKLVLGRLKEAAKARGLLRRFPDMANMAQEIRQKRREEVGEGNMVDDTAERKKDGIARRSRRTKKSLFGDGNA
jgi:hypothetical protein